VKSWLPILTFHDLSDRPSVISFPPALFARGMARLEDAGCRTLRLTEAADRVRRGESFPDRAFVLTFDDGYRSVHDVGLPVLREHGFAATVFLTVGPQPPAQPDARLPSMMDRSMLSWAEVRRMHAAGIEFGAHTLTHPDLTAAPADRLEAEVAESKAILADALGAEIDAFCYPFGRYDAASEAAVRRHFPCACSDRLGLVTRRSDPLALERLDAWYFRGDRRFGLMTTRWLPSYVRACAIARRVRRVLSRTP
jgi:peptidoglycan/xylan/chitin deacetylase (PgdA/CDA1 family)